MNKEELQAAVDAIPYWYHKIALPHGVETNGWAPIDASMYRIPDDLTGKRVLDIGAWDGFWCWKALERGAAHVTAIDDFSDTCGKITDADRSSRWRTFDLCAKALSYRHICEVNGIQTLKSPRVARFEHDVQREIPVIEAYDSIFCFGVLYHLRHPLLALENMREVCRGTLHVETAILDNCQSAYDADRGYDGTECCAEFYPNDEYGMNKSNWHVGTLRYWCALVESAGFKNIESWRLTDSPKSLAECRGFIRATV